MSFQVRYTTLLAFREVVRKLGEDYLVLFPEAVPFLAELMEGKQPCMDSQTNLDCNGGVVVKVMAETQGKYEVTC